MCNHNEEIRFDCPDCMMRYYAKIGHLERLMRAIQNLDRKCNKMRLMTEFQRTALSELQGSPDANGVRHPPSEARQKEVMERLQRAFARRLTQTTGDVAGTVENPAMEENNDDDKSQAESNPQKKKD